MSLSRILWEKSGWQKATIPGRELWSGSATHPTLFFPHGMISVIQKCQIMLKTIDHSGYPADRYYANRSEMKLNQDFMKTKIDHANMGISDKLVLAH